MTQQHEALVHEGWLLMEAARESGESVRCYVRGGLVTVGATLLVNDYADREVRMGRCTFLGRGPTIEAAVADLGASGLW